MMWVIDGCSGSTAEGRKLREAFWKRRVGLSLVHSVGCCRGAAGALQVCEPGIAVPLFRRQGEGERLCWADAMLNPPSALGAAGGGGLWALSSQLSTSSPTKGLQSCGFLFSSVLPLFCTPHFLRWPSMFLS